MTDTQTQIEWEAQAREKYDEMISKIPLFHREIARIVVDKKAVINAKQRGSDVVEEEDIVNAFLTEVPKAFYSLMIRLSCAGHNSNFSMHCINKPFPNKTTCPCNKNAHKNVSL